MRGAPDSGPYPVPPMASAPPMTRAEAAESQVDELLEIIGQHEGAYKALQAHATAIEARLSATDDALQHERHRAETAEHKMRMLEERLRCVKLDPETAAYFDALDAMTDGRLPEALEALTELVKKNPSNVDYRTGLELARSLDSGDDV